MENKHGKTLRTIALILTILILATCSFAGGFASGHYLLPGNVTAEPTLQPQVSTPVGAEEATPKDLQSTFAPFWEAWNIVHEQYVEQPVDDLELMQGAIRGMMDALPDEHSGYMDPQETSDVMISMSGEYEGIGAWVETGGDYLTIIEPIPGSPAEAAGIRPGDQIIAVDGEDVTGMDPDYVRRVKVMGPAGTDVTLTILREGEADTLDITITRATITVPSTEARMLENDIAYIQLLQFAENTDRDLRQILTDLLAQGARGVILDLRDNTGGYTDTATRVASEFISEGVIWYEQYGDGSRSVHEAIAGGLATDIPLVVLINESSASASELVAGAIQDDGRGVLVGVTSYGKGSVQNWAPLSDGSTVRVTIAKWLTPNEHTIHGIGLTPDVIVEISDDDQANNRDPQLDRAIQILLQEISGASGQ